MSFASMAREELSRLPLGKACCVRAEAAGMLTSGGVIQLSGGRRGVYVQSEQGAVARRAFSLFKRAYGVVAELSAYERTTPGSVSGYRVLILGEAAGEALEAAGLDALGLRVQAPGALLGSGCCRRAYLRGAFLLCGTLGDPGKGYHMEWRLARESSAHILRGLLEDEGLRAGVTFRRERHVVYLKEAESIADALRLMGAVRALLELENVRVVKEVRNRVNRQVNCENANVDKAMDAAYRQIEAIEYLEAQGILSRLSKGLREAAELRAEHPEATMEELGMLFPKPLAKSGVNHRLRRLVARAREHMDSQLSQSDEEEIR